MIAIFFVLSIQLAWWILLYGAEVAACLGRPAAELRGARGIRPDPWIGLAALARLAAPGRPSLDDDQLAAALGIPAHALRDHLGPLSDRGLLEAPLTPAGTWRLAVAPARVRLDTLFAAYHAEPSPAAADHSDESGEDAARAADAQARLAELRSRLASARSSELGDLTLDDWLRPRRSVAAEPIESLDDGAPAPGGGE